MSKRYRSSVNFEPAVSRGVSRGVAQLVAAIRPTLGPTPHLTAVERSDPRMSPELLDEGGVIARRVTELANRDENLGAMMLRGLLWRLHEEVGDGTATAAVLFESIYQQGWRLVTAGANPARLAHHLHQTSPLVTADLRRAAVAYTGEPELIQIAASVGADEPLAALLGETFSVIGEHGRLDIRRGHHRELRHEYVDGHAWKSRIASLTMLTDVAGQRARLEEPVIVLSDLDIDDPHEAATVLGLLTEWPGRPLVIIARRFSPPVLSLLLANHRPPQRPIVAMVTPGQTDDDRRAALDDMVHLAGGRALRQAAGDRIANLRACDLGAARHAWAFAESFGITGGKGNPRDLRQHINVLSRAFDRCQDNQARRRLQERIGTLQGGTVTLWVGASTEAEAMFRKRQAEQVATVLRGVIAAGVVPGGGSALYGCRPALQRAIDESADDEERCARQIVYRALSVPLRTIAENAGADASHVVARVERSGPGIGFDARTGDVVDMIDAGIMDAAHVQQAAVHGAITTAALALTINVAVHGKTPPLTTRP